MATVPAFLRRRVVELARGRCEYCRLPASHSPNPFDVDHVQPRSREGDDDESNLALCCPGCNGAKYNKIEAPDLATGVVAPLFHPRQQRWRDHFAWSDDKLIVVGLTATGRATVVALHLNREGVVNLRELLLLRDLHPPRDE